jgi:hypothetical protein
MPTVTRPVTCRDVAPQELFDNLEYESHTPDEWIALGKGGQVSKGR